MNSDVSGSASHLKLPHSPYDARGSHTLVFLLAESWRPSPAPCTSLSDGVTELCGPLRSGEASDPTDPTYSPCPPLQHLWRPRLVSLKRVTGPLCGRRAGLDTAAGSLLAEFEMEAFHPSPVSLCQWQVPGFIYIFVTNVFESTQIWICV